MRRGEIWWAELGLPDGSVPGYRRPVLVIQADGFNISRISTVVCVVLTSNIGLARAPGNVLVRKEKSKLPKDSVINVSQIITLDKSMFIEPISRLTSSELKKVETGIHLVLGLNKESRIY